MARRRRRDARFRVEMAQRVVESTRRSVAAIEDLESMADALDESKNAEQIARFVQSLETIQAEATWPLAYLVLASAILEQHGLGGKFQAAIRRASLSASQ